MEFSFPWVRWLIKTWFWISALFFLYLFWIDIFVYRWFILLWAMFSAGLGAYVAPAIRVEPSALHVKYLWRYRPIPWSRVLEVHRTLLGAQIMTVEPHWAYRVVGYQYPMPGVRQLEEAVGEVLERAPPGRDA